MFLTVADISSVDAVCIFTANACIHHIMPSVEVTEDHVFNVFSLTPVGKVTYEET